MDKMKTVCHTTSEWYLSFYIALLLRSDAVSQKESWTL
jgi:hypothetical protein